MTTFTRFNITQNPFELAKKGQITRGMVFTKDMPRIAALVGSNTEFTAQLEFGVDGFGFRVVVGSVEGELDLQCQRCLEHYAHQLSLDFTLGLVKSEQQISRLPEAYEPLLVENEVVFLRDIVEDEIVLALPTVPMHNETECQVKLNLASEQRPPRAEEELKKRPFEVLAGLLKKDKG